MASLTGEGNSTSRLNQVLSAPPAGIAEFLLALNIFLSITAAVGNVLILIALKDVSSIHSPTKLFFRCLAVTDLCVGLFAQPMYATRSIFRITKMNATVYYYAYKVDHFLGYILCGVSVMTCTAISVDRLLALLLGLRYRHVVTLRRVSEAITFFWLMSSSFACLSLWREDIVNMTASAVLILCLPTSIFCYTKIHLKLRHQQAQVQNIVPHGQQNGQGSPLRLNIAKYKKSVSSMMWVQLALVACYVPWGIVAALYSDTTDYFVLWEVAATLVCLNSSLNPILYCWKIREVKQAVKGTIRQVYCC